MPKIVNLAERNNDAKLYTPMQALQDAMQEIEAGKRTPTKLAVLYLDDRDMQYKINFRQAGMSMSEMVALLTLMQTKVIKDYMDFRT